MRPDQLAKSGSEHAHQAALFAWCAVAALHGFDVANSWAEDGEEIKDAIEEYGSKPVPDLKWFHAIPNGGSRGDDAQSRKIRGANLKAEGVRTGVADTFLPVRRNGWPGLYIEMKKPGKANTLSKEQIEFGVFVKSQGYGWIMCDHWKKARDVLIQYLTCGEQP